LFAQDADSSPNTALTRFEFEQVRFAAPVRLVVYAPSEAVANKASREVFDRLRHFDRVMSDYDPDSELSRLCASSGSGKPVQVSDELFAVIAESQRLAEATGGAFDITVAPVVKLWRAARRKKQLPTAEQQEAAMALVGYRSVRLDPAAKTVELLKPGMQLDLGGIAQGYAADDAMRILNEAGITRALVDVSGDIRVGEAPPDRDGWRVEIEALKSKNAETPAEPRFVTLTNAAISTAGDAYQFTEIEGVRYSHIIDARTGRPMSEPCSVTVIAKDALTADGLDTALCLLEDVAGRTLASTKPGVRVVVARVKDGRLVTSEFGSEAR
jgi:thiamine biosynthesis lipoprotein